MSRKFLNDLLIENNKPLKVKGEDGEMVEVDEFKVSGIPVRIKTGTTKKKEGKPTEK